MIFPLQVGVCHLREREKMSKLSQFAPEGRGVVHLVRYRHDIHNYTPSQNPDGLSVSMLWHVLIHFYFLSSVLSVEFPFAVQYSRLHALSASTCQLRHELRVSCRLCTLTSTPSATLFEHSGIPPPLYSYSSRVLIHDSPNMYRFTKTFHCVRCQ